MKSVCRITMYLDYATRQARRHIPMTMADWASKLDAFLQVNDAEICSAGCGDRCIHPIGAPAGSPSKGYENCRNPL